MGTGCILQGALADAVGLQLSFALTVLCELYILFYALWGTRPTRSATNS